MFHISAGSSFISCQFGLKTCNASCSWGLGAEAEKQGIFLQAGALFHRFIEIFIDLAMSKNINFLSLLS